MKVPVVTITNYCLNHVGYFDWLVTGFGFMQQQGKLELRMKLPAAKAALSHRYVRWGAKAIAPEIVKRINGAMWWLEGEIDFGGTRASFVFDVTDHGNAYAEHLLPHCHRYFKCQLPDSFPQTQKISSNISRSMPAEAIEFAHKVKPAMLGRPLSRALDVRKNISMLHAWESKASARKSTRVFAYFGGDSDPEATNRLKDFQGLYQHPNVKRGRLVKYLRNSAIDRVDARLVHSQDPSLSGPELSDDESYSKTVSSAAYNLNISGLSLSLPFRFIDSFVVGTAILTDTLGIHWYEPFDAEEVIELGTMGYELEGNVDWPTIESRLLNYINSDSKNDAARFLHLRDRYKRLWSPQALAQYVLESCEKSLQ
jgi:hypothetical protein